MLTKIVSAAVALSLTLSSCSSLPSGAPTSSVLLSQDSPDAATFNYVLLDISPDVARIASAASNDTFAGQIGGRGVGSSIVIGRGDALNITIFEAASNGLFTSSGETTAGGSAGAKNVTLPQVLVDASGNIRVPYASEIKAAGRTTRQVEAAIEEQLKRRAIEPQVVVTIAANKSALVTVSGEVKSPSRLQIDTANERLLDALAEAGGSTLRPFEATVTVERGKRHAAASLKAIYDNPRENVFIRPGDTILVQRRQRSVTVIGAEEKNIQLPFDNDTMTLAYAIGSGGGLDDARASLSGVYVFRMETPDIIQKILPGWTDAEDRAQIPTLYRVDLGLAQGYFLAQQFHLRDQDVVLVANASGAQVNKVLQQLGQAFGIGTGLAAVAITASTLRK